MTREEAIKVCTREKECVQSALDVCADGGHYVSPDGIITAMDYVEAMIMAIAALREQGGSFQNGNDHNTVKDWPPYMDLPREQEELERNSHGVATACEYCNGSGKRFIVDDDIPFGSYNSIRLDGDKAFLDDADGLSIRIKFCPMCGRRLEEL